jgi:drug/metabolite transporter (DMT)-like permease
LSLPQQRSGSPAALDTAALVTGLLAVSFSAILIRLCVSPPSQIAFWRTLLAGAVFLGWELFRHRKLRIDRRDLLLAIVGGAFLAAHFYFWIASLFMTSIHSSVVLLATQPLFALILQVVISRRGATARNLLSVTVGLGGAFLLARGDFAAGGTAGMGDLFAIFSAAMAACYLFTGAHRRSPLLPYLSIVYLSSGFFLLLVTISLGEPLTPVQQIDWLWFALLTILPTLVGHTLLNRSTRYFAPYVVNLSILAEPVLTSLWAWVFFREVITSHVATGGVIILLAVAIEFLPRRRPPLPEKAEVPRLAD